MFLGPRDLFVSLKKVVLCKSKLCRLQIIDKWGVFFCVDIYHKLNVFGGLIGCTMEKKL